MNNVDYNLEVIAKRYPVGSSVVNKAVEAMHYMDRLNKIYTNLIDKMNVNLFSYYSEISLDEQLILRVMIDSKFDYVKTVEAPIFEKSINGTDVINSCKYLISVLKKITKSKPVKEVKKARTLIDVKFKLDDDKTKDTYICGGKVCDRFKPKGLIVSLSYYVPLAKLWVFDFEGSLFPLYENEFEWL